MLKPEENELLTRVGPGTPMGELMRRYWHPVGTVADLDQDPVQPVRILGEDLTLFRYSSSPLPRGGEGEGDPSFPLPRGGEREGEGAKLGLIADRCAHRGLSMAYGIPQRNGLRCAYHGWTYDTEGHVVDMPFEPACLPLRIKAYAVEQLCGIIWAYLGPEPRPLLPRWDVLVRDDFNKEIRITPLQCNWLQCMDNSLDPSHFEHLHGVFGNYLMKKLGRPPIDRKSVV